MKRIKHELEDVLCEVIKQQRLLRFYFESDSGKKWRTVEPYMVIITDYGKGEVQLVGLPTSELKKDIGNRHTGHYYLLKMDTNRFKVLKKTYSEPNVPRKQIINTPTVEVICRYYYPDESGAE